MGDHFTQRDEAQNLANHIGKIVRVTPDGAVPPDNPFVGRNDAKPEIWSYGHRNAQGAALHPQTGKLWEHEHGPRGGDEINIPLAGKNYGWPVIGYGIDYCGAKIHEATAKAGMEQPVKYWVPSIAPSGMAFYTGDLFPAWKGNLFVGALAGQMLVRLELDGEKVGKEERLLHEPARAHPRRAPGPGRRDLAADRQRQREAAARHAGEIAINAAAQTTAIGDNTRQSGTRAHTRAGVHFLRTLDGRTSYPGDHHQTSSDKFPDFVTFRTRRRA